MLRPIKLNSAAYPRTRKTNQSGFNNFVIVNKIVAVCFVICTLNSAAEFRQNHYVYIIVFKDKSSIFLICLFVRNFFCNGQRIHLSRTALISSLFNKKRCFFRFAGFICWNKNFFFSNCCFHFDYLDNKSPSNIISISDNI